MGETIKTKLLIIGSGPAGYTAAIYAARAMLEPVLVAGIQPGGQMTITTDVENYPGFADVIQGPWLMEEMRKQAEHVGTRMIYDHLTELDLSRRPFVVRGDGGNTYVADAIVLATGAQAKWLGLPSEDAFKGYGVSACATCDGFFYRGKEVLVVGGGNTAVEEALYLTNHASKVTLVHRRGELRAERILQERLFAHPKVEIIWHSALAEVLGGGTPPGVTGARLTDTRTGEERTIDVDGIFIAIGHAPATELVADKVRL
ncbi:MAG: FAD-dependent oxidoreductase, partial [Pseudomonadota bacterium]